MTFSRTVLALAWLLVAGFCGYIAVAHWPDMVIMPFYGLCALGAASCGTIELVRP